MTCPDTQRRVWGSQFVVRRVADAGTCPGTQRRVWHSQFVVRGVGGAGTCPGLRETDEEEMQGHAQGTRDWFAFVNEAWWRRRVFCSIPCYRPSRIPHQRPCPRRRPLYHGWISAQGFQLPFHHHFLHHHPGDHHPLVQPFPILS